MELKAYLVIFWRRKWIVVVTLMVTIILAVGGALVITPKYKTAATLRVGLTGGSVGYGDLLYAQRLMNTFPSMVTSAAVLTQLKQQIGIAELPEISVEFRADSELMQIIVEGKDREKLADVVNILAELLINENRKSKAGRIFEITLIDPAVTPKYPSGPGKSLYIVMGTILGLTGGLGLAFLFENLDTRLYTKQQIEAASDLTILAQIPSVKRGQSTTFLNGISPQGESYRRLRTNILALGQDSALRTILITSAEPGEGKSTTVVNLALALAHTGHKVVLVDSDLRRPTIHKICDLANQNGLSSVLTQKTALVDALQDSHIAGISVLTSGPLPSNSAELLEAPEMSALIKKLSQTFDFVLIDTPALLPVIDAAIPASFVDGVLLIVSHGQTRREDVEAVCQQLAISKAKTIGVVANRMGSDSYHQNYYRSYKEEAPTIKFGSKTG